MRNITASVGLRGVNKRDDVRTVQELLNLVPHSDGGPLVQLATDGICGRKTNGAIEKLQAHEWGWPHVDTRVDRNGPTWKLLVSYDKPAAPAVVAPPKPDPPKVVGTRFMILMAVKPNARIAVNGENFYFQIINQMDQTQQAIYHLGNMTTPPPDPTPWSISIPAIVVTPQPLGAADWAGEGIFFEKQERGAMRTEIWVMPDALKSKTIRFGVHAHLDDPSPSADGSSSSFSAPFRLREVSQGVQLPPQ